MVNAQEWLDSKYPKEKRSKAEEILLNEPSLAGELDLGEFTCKGVLFGGIQIHISPLVDKNKLTFKNLPKYAEIIENSWKDIHGGFWNNENQNLWEQQGFTYKTTKEWANVIDQNFKPKYDSAFCSWIRDQKNLTSQTTKDNLTSLKAEYNNLWTSIDKKFSEMYYNTAYQQRWERQGFTYQEAQEWITVGFAVDDYNTTKIWKNHSFTAQETKSWLDSGLDKNNYELASYLKKQNLTPQIALLEKSPAQTFLDWKYPKNERREVKGLYISNSNLTGSLDLSDFNGLERLDCPNNKLTKLNLAKGEKLREIRCENNNLKQDLAMFSSLVGLEELYIRSNPFSGSLEPLTKLEKLKRLDISDTDLDFGLEYLSDNLEYFKCSVGKRPEAKVKAIYNLFADEKGWIETEIFGGSIKNFPQKLSKIKQQKRRLSEQIKADISQSNSQKINQRITEKKEEIAKIQQEIAEKAENDKKIIREEDSLKAITSTPYVTRASNSSPYTTQQEYRSQVDNLKTTKLNLEQRLTTKKNELVEYQKKVEELQKERQLFQNQETKINYLELRVQELTNLIKQQKEKIINTFLRLFPEKELLQELIKIHLEFVRAVKQELPAIKLRRQRDKLQYELENKIEDELAEKIQLVLSDCEDLISWELELETKLNSKFSLIEEQKQTLLQITDGKEEVVIHKKHEVVHQEQTKEQKLLILYNELWEKVVQQAQIEIPAKK